MKKTLLVIMAVLCGLTAMAQEQESVVKSRRPKYVTLGYVLQQDVTLASGEVIKPEFGAMLNRGRTFYFHRNPIANFLNIGVDATWIDVNYAMYKPFAETTLHQAELAVQVGPSLTFTPVKRLQVHLYGRFAPTFAMRYDSDAFGGNYASMFVAGGNLSFGFFGVGAEYRWSNNMKYKAFGFNKLGDVVGDLGSIIGGGNGENQPAEAFVTRASEGATDTTEGANPFFGKKNLLEGLRVYVTFRF